MEKEKWISPYLKQYGRLFLLAILLGTLTILFGAGLMFTSGYLITKASTRPESILMVYVPIVGVRTFGIGRTVLGYVERLTGHQFVLKILSDMRVRLYDLLEPQAVLLRSRFQTGDLLGVLADDIENLQNFYLKTLLPSIVSLVIYAVIIICSGLFSIAFAILFAVLIGLLTFVGPIVSFIYKQEHNKTLKQGRQRLYQQFTDAVFGISDWLFSGRYADFIESTEEQQRGLLRRETKLHLFANWRSVFNQMVLGVTVIISIYWADGMAKSGEIPATFIAAVGLVMLSLLESFLPISEAVSEASAYQDSIKRLESIEPEDSPEWLEEEEYESTRFSDVPIELNHVSFQYSGGSLLINDFSLKVDQGEKIAILGPSGAGKSTLLKLLQGALEPKKGEVLLNQRKANEVLSAIPKMLSVLNQKPYLFHTTVLENIKLGNPEATNEEVFAAAEQVGLHQMIQELPNGYNTNMQETGKRFSGGEQQRIALARILLQRTPVVIMDEPTVGLDPITENQLLSTIFNTLKGKTIIWVTHHLAGMEKMDRIIFMDQGKITMSGSHRQLLQNEERYRNLYSLDHPLYIKR